MELKSQKKENSENLLCLVQLFLGGVMEVVYFSTWNKKKITAVFSRLGIINDSNMSYHN